MESRPKIGVAVIVQKGDKVLCGFRKSAHGNGTWAFPGGHLEFGESIEDCAQREAKEETGLELKNLRLGPFTNDIYPAEGKHYVTIFTLAEIEGEPKALEPEKCEEWSWFKWDEIPEPLFLPIINLKRQGFDPFSE